MCENLVIWVVDRLVESSSLLHCLLATLIWHITSVQMKPAPVYQRFFRVHPLLDNRVLGNHLHLWKRLYFYTTFPRRKRAFPVFFGKAAISVIFPRARGPADTLLILAPPTLWLSSCSHPVLSVHCCPGAREEYPRDCSDRSPLLLPDR